MPGGFLDNLGADLSSIGGGAEKLLAHPLVQAAVASYLGAIGTPKYEGLGAAISRGGLAGLGAFGQARQQQQALPYLQARTGVMQQEAERGPLEKQSLQQQVAAQGAKLAPISPEEIGKLDAAIAAAPSSQEKAYYGFLKQEYQNRRLTADDLAQRLDPHMAALMSAQAKMYSMRMGYDYLTGQPLQPPPSYPGATPGPAVGAAAAPMGGASNELETKMASWATAVGDGPEGKKFGQDATDGKWYEVSPDGAKGAAMK